MFFAHTRAHIYVILCTTMNTNTSNIEQYQTTSTREYMRTLPVRACSIVCVANPEWGTWGVMEDKGNWYVILGRSGSRVLFKSEAVEHWDMAPGSSPEPRASQSFLPADELNARIDLKIARREAEILEYREELRVARANDDAMSAKIASDTITAANEEILRLNALRK